jgi:predicted transcriptional regulator
MEEVAQIKQTRRKLGLTQHQLASMSGVSQSLIAKIEAGDVDASYSKVKGILEALSNAQLSSEKTAKEIMHAGLETVRASDLIHSVAAKMRKHSISQMPVIEGGHIVGSISEQAMLEVFSGGSKTESLKVSDIMDEAFPTALPGTPISAIAALLRHHPAVLVMEKGKIAGIITKADLLRAI